MMYFRDLLCDACLFTFETTGAMQVSDMCKRCQKKVLDWINNEARTDLEDFDEFDDAE